ncbi:MAG: hypothetical protein H6644_19630 [Caldilineaceae bacterium]|nr:hypothetical protein [Caldilineaceae bacterium]
MTVAQNAMLGGRPDRARHEVGATQRLSTTTLGLVGFGRSAIHTARRARGFGMRVLATLEHGGAADRPDAGRHHDGPGHALARV